MAKRVLVTLAAMAAAVVALGYFKVQEIQTAAAEAAAFRPPPEAVTTLIARLEAWPETLGAVGSVAAARGVTVSADLPGVVVEIAFESGRSVAQGATLVALDTRQERAQLAAAEAQRDLTRLNLERAAGLLEQGVLSRAEYDRLAAEHKQAEARVGEIRATIERKTIRAPFAGILGIRQVDLGQYLGAGDPVVPLQSLDPVHVNFSLPQQELARLRIGADLVVTAEGHAGGEFLGSVSAVDSRVDERTRNVSVQATLANPQGRLRPGMFVRVRVGVGDERLLVALPASAVSYAPYGDSVFVVGELAGPGGARYRGVRQQFVGLGPARGDQVAVLSGVDPGDEVVTSGVFKLRNGAAVQVNNSVLPGNDAAPSPEDN